jgi:hypothetical protein
MKKVYLLLLILIFGFLPVFSAQHENDTEWVKVAENNYINPDGIIGLENIYGFSFLLKAYNKGQYEPVNGKKIWYTMSQYTLDCAKQKYKIGVIDSYGFKDNFINGDYNRYAQFQPIVQGSAVGEVAKKLCRP